MKEAIIKLNSDHIKVKGGEYVQDFVRCQDCKHWVYNFNGCKRNPCTEPWYATDGCTYGERDEIRKRYKEPYLDADLDTVPSADVIERSVVTQLEEHAYDCGMEKGSEICQECGKHKRGEWEEIEVFHNGDEPIIEEWQSARCSVCNKYHTTPYMYYFDNYNFCPNCGADMRKEGKR